MANEAKHNTGRQVLGWGILATFVAGFFYGPVGVWTGPVLGAWFIGTQRVRRGFVWVMVLTFVPMAIGNWRMVFRTGPVAGLEALVWMLAASAVAVAPLVVYRMVSAHLRGLVSTLPLPTAGVLVQVAALEWLPAKVTGLAFREAGWWNGALREIGREFGTAAVTFAVLWAAAIAVWMWNREAQAWKFAATAAIFAAALWSAAWVGRLEPAGAEARMAGVLICVCGVVVLSVWALADRMRERRSWARLTGNSAETVALLRSPGSLSPLHVEGRPGGEALVSAAGEKFPIRDGVPDFRTTEDLSGANGKYNHLYETIGGFYDDTQRVACALAGMDRDAYVMSYLGKLEVRPGDKVLETSVGTGLNFKYLPRDIRRYGLDLAWDMLANCKANLRRWGMEGELFLGNAERLPFADESFDVVFHTGGINFFSDRAKAIGEMIRVAKPGSLILIADETEEHVKAAYENIPYTREFYKDRKEAVAAPVELVPAEMEEVRVETVWKRRFYALTFRKPLAVQKELHPAGAGALWS